jgi:hypothetical protein
VRLDRDRCAALLERSERGVLGTVHAERGVDVVPVCFVVDGTVLAVPIDSVKPKTSPVLQRSRNLDADARAVLLCDHWDPGDWTRLWWVRAWLERVEAGAPGRERLASRLAAKYPQYRDRPFSDLLVFEITGTDGWSAAGP